MSFDPNAPEPIRPFVEPQIGREYLLYRPSQYDARLAWPLIVVCHGGYPDSPDKRIRTWTRLAEAHGFLVAAPTLEAINRLIPRKPEQQLALQRTDETHLLAMVRHIRAGHNVSEDRIFLHATGGGAYPALVTALRHADLFRAVAFSKPKFDERYLADAPRSPERLQPFYVNHDVSDVLTGRHARRMVEWLRGWGAHLVENTSGDAGLSVAERHTEFFRSTVRDVPWLRIRALPGPTGNPNEVHFKLKCSLAPLSFRWDFGDGRSSTEPEPVHTYAAPDTYDVTVTVRHKDATHKRTAPVSIPEGTVGRHRDPDAPR